MVEVEVSLPEMEAPMRIIEGRVYRYVNPAPAGCAQQLYKVLHFVQDVPTYQDRIVVIGLTGEDKGKKFCCSPIYFANRFLPAVEEVKGCSETPRPPQSALCTPCVGGREVNFAVEGKGW